MIYLVDTNFLARFVNQQDPQHPVIKVAVERLIRNGHELRASSQNYVEFWSLSTRPKTARGGYAATIAKTDQWLKLIEIQFPILPELPELYPEWRRLVVAYNVSGSDVYDARLVAAMNVNNITHILTFDKGFTRYTNEGIVAVDPAQV